MAHSNIMYSNRMYSEVTCSNITHINIMYSNIIYSEVTYSNIIYSNIMHSNITYSNKVLQHNKNIFKPVWYETNKIRKTLEYNTKCTHNMKQRTKVRAGI